MRISILAMLLMPLVGCINHGASNRTLSNIQEKDGYQKDFFSYADALNEYAKVVPVIGQDSEASWAAPEVQAMRDSIASGCLTTRECLAMVYRMQTMAAYGLTYFSSILGLDTDESENAAYAFHSAYNFNQDYSKEKT